jgi:outer membrane receptor for ferrienterochelin and colicin
MQSLAVKITKLTAAIAAFVLVIGALAAKADQPLSTPAMGTVSGNVVDRDGSVPISGATIDLIQGTTVVASTKADKFGVFSFKPVPAGTYALVVRAQGYGTVRSDAILVSPGPMNLALVMQRAYSAAGVRSLGRVAVTSHSVGLQSTTTIQSSVDTQVAQRTNQIRTAESLGKLPEVNLGNTSSSVGDDIQIDIRGLKNTETQTMLDGHPIGPIGVLPPGGGGTIGFNYSDSPLFAIENSLVTYGSGAVGLYGIDAIGGSVDMQTYNPTLQPHGEVTYGIGQYGKQTFGLHATGTDQKIGYALAYGSTGTWGNFPGATIQQTGSRGTDWSASTVQNTTYWVSANYTLKNALGKIRYDFSPSTSLTLTGYSATEFDDKTGNGDNDNLSAPFVNEQFPSNCVAPGGVPGQTITLTPPSVTPAKTQCISQQQFLQGASGPSGGGPLPWQTIINQDYHARFLTTVGKNQIVADYFTDNYVINKNRPAQCVDQCANDSTQFFLNPFTGVTNPVYRTFGGLVSDDIYTGKNDVGFGIYQQRQYDSGFAWDGSANPAQTPYGTLYTRTISYFVRDAYTPTTQLNFFLNAWEKDSLIGGWSFDPRLTVMYRPDPADVIRLTGGGASADPQPIAPSITTIGGITPGNCQQVSVGSLQTPGELPEKATDEEISLAHRWVADTITQFTGYDTNVRNSIFDLLQPAGPYIPLINFYGGSGYIPAVLAHVNAVSCASTPITAANLFVDTNVNIGAARARGYEINQRWRVNPHLVLDGYWDVQSVANFDIPDSYLMNNVNVINGSQIAGIPLHKWGAYMDFTTDNGGEVYLDYVQVDSNNSYQRASYGTADLAITQQVAKHTFVNLGVSNVFNQAVDTYGRIGLGVFIPQNQFGDPTITTGLQQGTERFGIAPASLSFSVTQRW